MGAAWALFLGDWLANPMEDGARIIVVSFVGGLFSVRTFEKIKGVA
jgi:hypothetical protein